MITLVAVDPGNNESAAVAMEESQIFDFGKFPNEEFLKKLDYIRISSTDLTVLVIEMVQSYGMPVGGEVFQTCVWIGRFIERWRGRHDTIFRQTVKARLCNDVRAKDSNVRAAIIERYGGKMAAIGNARKPGPLHGVTGDVWAALAVAVTYRADVGSGLGLLA
jgi:hypothetical protein